MSTPLVPLSEDIRNFAAALLGSRAQAVTIEADARPALIGALGLLAAQARALEADLAALEAIAADLYPHADATLRERSVVDCGADAVLVETDEEAALREALEAGKVLPFPRSRRAAFCDGRDGAGGAA